MNTENKDRPGQPVLLREMTAGDIPAVSRIESECFGDAWSKRLLGEMLDGPFDEAWVLAPEGGEPVAYANFRFLAGEGELMRIAVLPERRGRGYARRLMERLDISAREKQARDLTLEVRADNAAAVGLYESCGFCTEAVRKAYYTKPREDARIMWRRHA